MRFLSGSGIRKRLWATRRGICSCPLQLQRQKGQITDLRLGPALQQNPWLGQEFYLQHTPKQKHCTAPLPAGSARERPFCYGISSQNTELQLLLALSVLLHCRAESKSPFPSSYNRGFTDAREDEASSLCGERNKVDYTWELQETPNLSVQSSLCSASQHLQNQFGTTQTRAGERQNSSMHCEAQLGQHGSCRLLFTCRDISPVHRCGVWTLASLNKAL